MPDCYWLRGMQKQSKASVTNMLHVQWVPEILERLDFFHVNKSCKIECCGNKTHQIIQNMILSQGLELKLSLL